jgi:hypothetical protein
MARKIKVSRHGLTRCPACQAHIQVAADASATTCPFCLAALASTPEPVSALPSLLRSALSTGRSGLLAAGLLSLSVAACAEEDPTPPVADTSEETDSGAQPAYGIPADVIEPEDAADSTVEALYGAVPDDTSSTSAPMYGIPADIIEPEDAEDAPVEALYGIVPADTTP